MKNRHSRPRRDWIAIAVMLCGMFCAGSASAQALKYTPNNPHFGGSPFNGAELLASAQAQRQYSTAGTSSTSTALQGFASNLDARISAGLSQYISNQMFSSTASGGGSGSVMVGTLKVDYVRNEGATKTVSVTMTDTKTNETQTVSYPLGIFVP
jgi:curli production assembly/transport component CsgF